MLVSGVYHNDSDILHGNMNMKKICMYVFKLKRAFSVMSDFFDPMDCSPPGSSVHGISQARILE